MRILLINPCLRRDSKILYLPVGLGYIATLFHDTGYKFDLLDVDLHKYDDQYVEDYIRGNKYDVILVGCIVTHYRWIKWCVKTIKKYQPDCVVVVGNSVGGSIPELFLTKAPADVIVMGEGEFSALDVLNCVRLGKSFEGVQGIAYRDESGNIKINPKRPACDINTLPMINWELFEIQTYIDKGMGSDGALGSRPEDNLNWCVMPVSTARGCIAKCTFCHYVYWDDPYRHRTPEAVLAEIKRNIEQYQANYINFWDDLSFSSVNSAEKMVDAILESGLKFNWSAAIRTDLFGNPKISYEKRLRVAQKFRDSGCKAVGFSLESGNEEILKMMEKKVKVEYFEEQVHILNTVGIQSHTSVVMGYPIETPDTIRETFEMCLRNRIYPSIGFLMPLPSTGMYKYAVDNGFIKDEDEFLDFITERQDICLNMTRMSDEELMSEIKKWATHLNKMLNVGLDKETLIRTGGYRKTMPNQNSSGNEDALDPENLKRNENDFNFNYSQQVFDINPSGKRKENC